MQYQLLALGGVMLISCTTQVRRLGAEVKAAHPNLYALVNNAGVFAERMQVRVQ